MSNPFLTTQKSHPGTGTIHISLLPPSTPRLRTLSYQYPLKLVSPSPLKNEDSPQKLIYTVYLLTYGGGLVAGDCINLTVTLEVQTRLILLTQGSTKLFKSPSRDIISDQTLTVNLAPNSALCFLPDPVQPFRESCFAQRQIYNISLPGVSSAQDGEERREKPGSLCVLDWVSNGRPANGENWDFRYYASRNEIYLCQPQSQQQQNHQTESTITKDQTEPTVTKKLLLRDNLLLDPDIPSPANNKALNHRMENLAVYATLILYGDVFSSLQTFFMDEFHALPRLGARKWDSTGSDDGKSDGEEGEDDQEKWRAARHKMESQRGILWSAAKVRGCVVVKFAAMELEYARGWIAEMLEKEGSVRREFGERALLCLRW